jgi:hypothetical protein
MSVVLERAREFARLLARVTFLTMRRLATIPSELRVLRMCGARAELREESLSGWCAARDGDSAVRELGARQGLREKLTYASRHRCLCEHLTKLWRSYRQCAHAHL